MRTRIGWGPRGPRGLLSLLLTVLLAAPAFAAALPATPASALPAVQAGTRSDAVTLGAARFRAFRTTAEREVYAGVPDLSAFANRLGRDTRWAGRNTVTVRYDAATGLLRATVANSFGTVELDYPNLPAQADAIKGAGSSALLARANYLQVNVRNADVGTAVSWTGVTLDGTPLGDFAGNGTASGATWHLAGVDLHAGFTLTGTLLLSGAFSASGEAGRADVQFGYVPLNQAPSVSVAAAAVVEEGSAVALAASGSDPDGDALTYAWSVGPAGPVDPGARCTVADAAAAATSVSCTDDGDYLVTVSVSDPGGLTASVSTGLSVVNAIPSAAAPTASPLAGTGPEVPSVGVPVPVSVAFSDAGTADTHSCAVDWADGTVSDGAVTEVSGFGSCDAEHTYTSGGLRVVRVTVTDDDGASTTVSLVFDIPMPLTDAAVHGAGVADVPPGTAGAPRRLPFAIAVKVRPGAERPTGAVALALRRGAFVADEIESATVDSAGAIRIDGSGSVRGRDGWRFEVVVRDGAPDTMRARVWNPATGVVLVDDAGDRTVVHGGIGVRVLRGGPAAKQHARRP